MMIYSKTIYIDIETFSSANLKNVGVHKYVESPDFKIDLITYGETKSDLKVVEIANGDKVPDNLLELLSNPNCKKVAHNAVFEMVCLSKYLNVEIHPAQWECTAILATAQGLPRSLGELSELLNLQSKKEMSGTFLINYFAKPCKPTKSNGGRTINRPCDNMDKWMQYVAYNIQDVKALIDLHKTLIARGFKLSNKELAVFEIDYNINKKGVRVDTELVNKVLDLVAVHFEKLSREAKTMSGLDNPNSVLQIKNWLETNYKIKMESLSKVAVDELINNLDIPEEVRSFLKIRQELGKSSIKKFNKLKDATCLDDYIKGTLMMNGAERTGRWAGRLVQVQNLPRNKYTGCKLDFLRGCIKRGDTETVELIYDEPLTDLLSQLIRTTFIPETGNTFVVSDYSAIEARVIAWLADEEWVINEFKGEGLIYEATASKMFNIPKNSIVKDNPNYSYRAKGKTAVLGLGYGGGVNALRAMGAAKQGMSALEMDELVKLWRINNRRIVAFWKESQKLALSAITTPGCKFTTQNKKIKFIAKDNTLYIKLPSGRLIAYQGAKITTNKWGYPSIEYQGRTSNGSWGRLETWGGKIAENITQAVARDVLAWSIVDLTAAGYQLAFHVHDEVVISIPNDINIEVAEEDIKTIMCKGHTWTTGLPLAAASFNSNYYLKD